jgi:prevent-host-death family protein
MARMESYNVAEARAKLSEILGRVAAGEEIVLTRRGKSIARLVPERRAVKSILGAGRHEANIDFDVLARDDWWKPAPSEAEGW